MENPDRITYFAATDSRGKRTPFGLKAVDRQRHMYVIGKTGMGKSTLLQNMAIQDIQNGEGMAFLDPHGSAVETLLQFIPMNRLDDVVYFAPFDLEHPIAFNIMEDVGYDKRHLVVSGLMATFKKIWEDAWSARMEYILTNTLLALLEYPDSTLLGVNRMYSDKAYRTKVVDNVKDPVVKAFWTEEYAKYTDKFAAEATPAIQNKIGQFTGNPLIRNIIGQPKSSFDIRELMDQKKILLINLSKGLVGDTNMRLLGSMLTTRIFLGAMSRAELNPMDLKNAQQFYFYVDEFQNFANDTFSEILSEARKYSLNLIIAHQYVEQMEEQVRAAVFGNVGTSVAFRVGPFDAETLETIFTPEFTKEDLVNIGAYRIYLTLMIDGVGSRPFSAATLPDIEPPPVTYEKEAIQRSREQFAAPRAKIEEMVFAELSAATAASAKPEPAKRSSPTPKESKATETRAPARSTSGPNSSSSRTERSAPPQERREERATLPRNDAPAREDRPRPDPEQNSKTAEDLKSILRSMSQKQGNDTNAGRSRDDKPAGQKGPGAQAQPEPLKGALADVLKRSDMHAAPVAASKPKERVPENSSQKQDREQQPVTAGVRDEKSKPYEVPEDSLRSIFNESL